MTQAILSQGLVILFCSGFKDGGKILLASLIASTLFWLCVPVVVWRARTPITLAFLRWGFIPFAIIGMLALRPLIWSATQN
jgi:hypothetical protein